MSESVRPDLAMGIPHEALARGQMVEGTYEGERVLLARVEDRFYAVGGACTHYGAPLCEGLLSGTMVHCPWHHARFDLESGRATAPLTMADGAVHVDTTDLTLDEVIDLVVGLVEQAS